MNRLAIILVLLAGIWFRSYPQEVTFTGQQISSPTGKTDFSAPGVIKGTVSMLTGSSEYSIPMATSFPDQGATKGFLSLATGSSEYGIPMATSFPDQGATKGTLPGVTAFSESDSLKAISLLNRAIKYSAAGNIDSARAYFMEARQICIDKGYPFTEARVYEGLALLYDQIDIWENTLKYMLMSANRYLSSYDSIPAASVFGRIAEKYLGFEVPSLAAQKYQREYAIYPGEMTEAKASAALNAARSYSLISDTTRSIAWHDSARVWFSESNNNREIFKLNNDIIPLLAGRGLNGKALELILWNMGMLDPASDREDWIFLNNNAGFLYFRLGDYENALNRFRRAEEYCLIAPKNEESLVEVYSNMAICYQNMGNNDLMMRYFKEAHQTAVKLNLSTTRARTEMILAKVYFDDGDFYNAELNCIDCIKSSRLAGNLTTLQVCYSLYADVLEAGNDFIQALDYYQKHLNLRDSLAFSNRLEANERAERNLYYETIEQTLRLDIADEELKDLTIRSQNLELEKQKSDIDLLKSQGVNDSLKTANLEQQLILSRQREEAQREKQKNDSLELITANQKIELQTETAKALELQLDNEKLAAETREKDLELVREQEARKMTLYIAVLMVLVVIGALYSLVSTRRKNQKLAASKKKIEEINADLEVKNTEIGNQKEIIEQKNQSITDSIQYAARIQSAVLPPLTFLNDWGVENFIFFRPKDIVSGDFYWGFRKKGRIYIAAADCTGHGVPGGFMSMLGNAFLNEIIITSENATASEILDKLRDEIIKALRQKGVTGEARDGMDISMVIIDRKAGYIQFAGANNPVYVVKNGELTRYQADRMPIGIHMTEIIPFTNHKIEVSGGDAVYLFSDGFADQFGGEQGKKFMYKPFQGLLARISSLPMAEQLEEMESTFDNWKTGHEQVDDVLVIGIRIR